MPRYVDHEDRRNAIMQATLELLAKGGLRAVTIREVARHLGGSATMVTHYYSTRSEILDDLAAQVVQVWTNEVDALDSESDDPLERLRNYMEWALPKGSVPLQRETARIRMLAERESFPGATGTFQAFDTTMRGDLRKHLVDLVPPSRLESSIELLRVLITGAVVLIVEHQDYWTPERQSALIASALETLGIVTSPAKA